MDKFKLVSPYEPTGDQPEAIKALWTVLIKVTMSKHFLA